LGKRVLGFAENCDSGYTAPMKQALWQRNTVWLNLFLGFSSGLPLALIGGTLQAWLTEAHVSLVDIGFFSLVGAAYTFKFLWSPLLDKWAWPFMDRRRSWMLVAQIGLIVGLLLLAIQNPAKHLWAVAVFSVWIAFASATQDTAIDAYRTDLLQAEERGVASAMLVCGYRLALILSGGLALIMAQYWGWRVTYIIMAACMLVGVCLSFFAPHARFDKAPALSWHDAVAKPFFEFFMRSYAVWILLFVVLYKLCDAFALSFISTFLLRGVGFDLATVGTVFKIYGVIAIIVGMYLGGYCLPRFGLFRSLLYFGLFQGGSNALLMLLAYVGKNYALLVISVSVDNLAAGMGTAAFMAFLMGLCDHRFTATQYALLSALSAVGRVFVGPVAGEVAHYFGWVTFFFISVVLMVPALGLLLYLRRRLSFEAEAIRAT